MKWLLDQPGGSVVAVTPRRDVTSDFLERQISSPGVAHYSWRGYAGGQYCGRRALYALPDLAHLNEIWGVEADAITVIEWNVAETAEWIAGVNPIQLLPGRVIEPAPQPALNVAPLPNGVEEILEHFAAMAAGYSSGLKRNEEDKLGGRHVESARAVAAHHRCPSESEVWSAGYEGG